MNLQKNFGIAVREMRTKLGLSQEKFALSIDMDRTYLASVEAGRRNISLANIQKKPLVLISAFQNYLK